MTREEFDAYCKTLPAVTHVIQWGGSSVWKVGGKIFAINTYNNNDPTDKISFKCSDFAFEVLSQHPGIIPAPYLTRAKWVQVTTEDALSNSDLESYLTEAHEIIAAKLTKAKQRELGLMQ